MGAEATSTVFRGRDDMEANWVSTNDVSCSVSIEFEGRFAVRCCRSIC